MERKQKRMINFERTEIDFEQFYFLKVGGSYYKYSKPCENRI